MPGSRNGPAAPAGSPTGDLLAGHDAAREGTETLADGAALLHGFAREEAAALLAAIGEIAAAAPFRHMVTPGGFRMSVAMTNCGAAGWVTDRRGYRYADCDPQSAAAWPAMPTAFLSLADRAGAAAGFPGFVPDACLINRYQPGARLSLHQDRDERDFGQPIVSVSLGLPAAFLFGGQNRRDRPRKIRLPFHRKLWHPAPLRPRCAIVPPGRVMQGKKMRHPSVV